MLNLTLIIFLLINYTFAYMNYDENTAQERDDRKYFDDDHHHVRNILNHWNLLKEKNFQKKSSNNREQNPNVNSDASGVLRKLKVRSHIYVASNNTIKNELLNEFLALKIYEFSDKINMMAIPEFRVIFENVVKIIKRQKSPAEDELIELGANTCILEEYAIKIANSTVPVCPWRWVILKRHDKFPFKRSSVKCNCVKCQAKTIYDSDDSRLSSCQPSYSLQPVLLRDSIVNETEKWSFALEEIANSCVCSLKLNPQI